MSDSEDPNPIYLSTRIVTAYVQNNAISPGELVALVGSLHGVIKNLDASPDQQAEAPEPAVPVERSVQSDCIICLEDGRKFKSLRRHLRSEHDMTPEEYRVKWGLSPDYPMVAPNYSVQRSKLAKISGLGTERSKRPKGQ